MYSIIDQIIILIMSFISIEKTSVDIRMVVCFLVAVICAAVCMSLEKRRIVGICNVLMFVIALFTPEQMFYMPILLYYYAYLESYAACGIGVVSMLPFVINCSHKSIAMLLSISVVSILLAMKMKKNLLLNKEIKEIRDDSEERSILLREKNKQLIKNQNQEIYVATLQERNRIAREIHDNVGHMLTRTILQLGALMTIHKNDGVKEELLGLKDNLDIAMNNIRQSVHDLHDESIDLKQSVMDIVKGLEDEFEVNMEYDIEAEPEKDVKYAIIGIVKEAVSNIIKYSEYKKVDITIRQHPAIYQLVIRDYGSRMDQRTLSTKKGSSEGIGLQNMKDRVGMLGGNISIENENQNHNQNGYRIFVTLPKTVK